MSYQTGPASSPTALLDTFKDFCVAAGWVLDELATDGTGHQVHIHKGTNFIHMRSFIQENSPVLGGSFSGTFGSGIAITGSNSWGGHVTFWERQPGAPYQYGMANTNVLTAIMPLPAAAIQTYWMFADPAGDNVVLVALKSAGIYNSISFGTLIKPQAYVGGNYFSATKESPGAFDGQQGVAIESAPPCALCGYLNATVDGWALWENITANSPALGNASLSPGKRLQSSTSCAVTNALTQQIGGDHIHYGFLRKRANSTRTGGLVLLPTLWLVERNLDVFTYGGGWSYAGQVPNIFQTTLVGYVPGAQYSISTDTYIVFPEFAIRQYP